MRILLNGLAALQQRTGIGRYIAEFADAYRTEFPDDEMTIWPREPRALRPSQPAGKAVASYPWTAKLRDRIKPAVRAGLQCHFGFACRRKRYDVYHEPNYLAFPCPAPTVLTVHDLSVIEHPEWHPVDRVRLHEKRFPRSLRDAAHIVTDSEVVRRAILARYGIEPERITAVPLGVSPDYRRIADANLAAFRRRLLLPDRFLLCVGTVEPRKNMVMLFRAYLDLPATVRENCPLVVVGSWGWKSDEARAIFEDAGSASGLRRLGYVADDDLPRLYSAATALLYPSLYEGFGLPPLEMFACGGAVVSSRDPAVLEATHGLTHGIDADDRDGWRNAMQTLIAEPAWADSLRVGVEAVAGQYSWQTTARRTRDIFVRVSRTQPTGPVRSR